MSRIICLLVPPPEQMSRTKAVLGRPGLGSTELKLGVEGQGQELGVLFSCTMTGADASLTAWASPGACCAPCYGS